MPASHCQDIPSHYAHIIVHEHPLWHVNDRCEPISGATIAAFGWHFCNLLCSLFNEPELRQFVALLPATPFPLASRLPPAGAPLSHLVHELLSLLERERMVDVALDLLCLVRSRSHPEISMLQALRSAPNPHWVADVRR